MRAGQSIIRNFGGGIARLAFHPLLLLSLFVLILAGAIIGETSSLKDRFSDWSVIFTLSSAFAMSGIVSFIFYFVVVFAPERRHRQVVKENLRKSYARAKRDIALEVIHASQLGGRNDLEADDETIEKMLIPDGFKELFSKGQQADEGYYAFQNQMSDRTPQYVEIIFHMNQISKTIDVVIDNYRISDQSAFDFFRSIQQFLARIEFQGPGYDASKPLCNFIWEIYAGWDVGEGYVGYDRIERLIEGI